VSKGALPYFARWCLGLAPAQTQTTQAERDCIARHAAGRRRLAEVGVWHGVTTSRLRQAMAPDGVLLAIDPFPPGRLGFSTQRVIARRTVGRCRRGRVVWLRATGARAVDEPVVRELGGIDFLFIDGDHSYEGLRGDWEAWSPLIVPGGCVALHDSCSTPSNNIDDAGSVHYTREVIRADPRFEVLEVVDTLTVVRRHVCPRPDPLAQDGYGQASWSVMGLRSPRTCRPGGGL
jgi:predicted O-methyltransferase YrrM